MKAYIFICPECGRQSMDDAYCEDCNVGGGFDEFVPATGHTELIEANDGWVSVDERLPNNYGEVLVCFSSTTKAGKINGMSCAYRTSNLGWLDAGCHENVESDGFVVTHWQPLPAPPTA